MTSTAPDPLVGALLDGRYRVSRRLASGGMSRVYIGHDDRLDRPVAIKVMNADLAADPPFIARFTREARAAARILHPNIVTVHDQGTDPSRDAVYLIMELVRGGTLRDLLRQHGRLSPAEALVIIEGVLTGLAIAHREGLVHRDIKPENILIDPEGRVLIADFGLARAVAESSHTTHSGMGGAVFGTIAYLSPEQITKGYADARSDVYATGVMLYEMLTGFPPYVADNPVSVAYRHVNDDVPPPSERLSDIPGELDDLVIEATTRDPLIRPPDAAAFLAIVRQTQDELGVRHAEVPVPQPPPALADRSPSVDQDSTTQASASGESTRPTGGDDDALEGDTGIPLRTTAMGSGSSNIDSYNAGTADGARYSDELHEADEPTRRRSRRSWLIPLAVVLVVVMASGALFWWVQYGRWTDVPDFSAAESEQQLSELASEHGVSIKLQERQFSETIPEGHVISADPPAGTRVTKGSQVSVVLSKGLERYYAESESVGQPADAVIAQMQQQYDGRVSITQSTTYHESIAKGSVVGFSPPSGTAMPPGSSVEVIVSDGRKPVPLPDVTGKSIDEASTMLTEAGFAPVLDPTPIFSDEDEGLVAQTDPEPGTELQPGANQQVTIFQSKGPDLVEVAGVLGMKTEEAEAVLVAAGFVVEISYAFTTLNLVANQDPTGGTMAKRGSSVTIVIA